MHGTRIKVKEKNLLCTSSSHCIVILSVNRDFVQTEHNLSASMLPSLCVAYRQCSAVLEIASGWFSKAKNSYLTHYCLNERVNLRPKYL